ncbi:MAG: GDP-L-fucose synthase [Candidatus Ozemobacteraceae bacterium]
MNKNSKIYVAGHSGMVGAAVIRCLKANGFYNLVVCTSKELDLTRQLDVEHFFHEARPEYVFLAAARVGGIMANKTYRAEFIYTNIMIQSNVIHSSWQTGVKKLLFFSSSCVYPRECIQPMKEEFLWTGKLEPTNEPYAVAKLSGMSTCRAYNEQHATNFISVIPTNLYGENDNFDPEQSHVMAALIDKFHRAKVDKNPLVTLWGTGSPRRELMYVDDAADAALFLMRNYTGNEPVNIGLGADCSIRELAEIVCETVGYQGDILFDTSKPDGIPRKLLDMSNLHSMGWKAQTPLKHGVRMAYDWYLHSIFASKSNPI